MSNPTRMEQLGSLLTAMIAVIVSGQSDLLMPDEPEPIHPAFASRLPYGFYNRAAKKLGVSCRCCRDVALGKMKADRVATGLLAALSDAEIMTRAETYAGTPLERAKPAYGTYSAIAKRLGCTPQHVRLVALGLHKSARVSRELERVGGVSL